MSRVPGPQSRANEHARPRPAAAALVVRRRTVIATLGAAALLTTWAALLTWYAFGRDDFVRRFLAREAELRADYDQRLGAMRARLEQFKSQKMVEQDGLEKRVLELASRQSALEGRQMALAGLARQAKVAALGAHPDERNALLPPLATAFSEDRPPSVFAPARAAKPMPAPETFGLRMREIDSGAQADRPSPAAKDHLSELPLASRVAALERSVEDLAAAQAGAIDHLLVRSRQETSRLRGLIVALGLDPVKGGGPAATGGIGGPLVPLASATTAGGGPLEAELDLLRKSLADLDGLRQLSAALPLRRPTAVDAEVTSGFGYRLDPFTRAPALHTGVDLRAEPGSPVRATGAGRVVSAEQAGGYGSMVEIDHGNRVVTRYAHLSSFEVAPGQAVAAGTVIGRVGSTGRSTGAHLHYETRIDGEPVDPRRFLAASTRLTADLAAER